MDWVILFTTSWILFFILKGWENLKLTIWSGILAVVLQMLVDTNAMTHQLYKIHNCSLKLYGTSVFFVLGPVFVIGMLICKFHPMKRRFRMVNIIVLTILYSAQEYLLLIRGSLEYMNWHFYDSIIVNTAAMVVISWFDIVVLNRNSDGGI
ncbi:hypothetical protein OXPF_18950 [Oxobacter pfennigii]|uniref:Uncharacterized protein n=1 Tax=Oxobacter pfennigii TaxID=36849 RepID=A0A0P8WAR0_9CLOT|nr:hypothetical protein [Oxobacter pfennigii]KPU44809.1 hypothetical protein OXPF_18950 [Oxobacter pfennigii]